MRDFRQRLIDSRKKKRYNQTQVALLMGSSKSAISAIEKGISKCYVNQLILFCLLYDVSPNYLTGFES